MQLVKHRTPDCMVQTRMASNSLLECFVYGMGAASDIERKFTQPFDFPDVPAWDDSQVTNADEDVVILQNWDELRSTMWNYVGIVRTTKRLQRALHRIEMLKVKLPNIIKITASARI